MQQLLLVHTQIPVSETHSCSITSAIIAIGQIMIVAKDDQIRSVLRETQPADRYSNCVQKDIIKEEGYI